MRSLTGGISFALCSEKQSIIGNIDDNMPSVAGRSEVANRVIAVTSRRADDCLWEGSALETAKCGKRPFQ